MANKLDGLGVSRRKFVKSAAVLACGYSSLGIARAAVDETSKRAYVGTYTGAGSNGEGIYLFEVNSLTGELSNKKLVAKTPSPSCIAIHPSKRYLYAVNEVTNYAGNSGSVSAFAIDEATGDLKALNVVSSEGAGPCYISIEASGKYAFIANYNAGTVTVLPITPNGFLGAATDVHRDSGNLGSAAASNAPQGSYAISGHDAPHAHMILPDPQGRFVLVADLGQDRIYAYRFDAANGKLNIEDGAGGRAPSGDGPRHLAFHPDGHWVYAIQEEASNVIFFHYDPNNGTLVAQQTISALPKGFAGTSFASEILVSPNGKFLYSANRLHDSIAAFSIGSDGRLSWIGEASTMGDYPAQCRIDPSGSFLYACNLKGDSITCFRIHRETGVLSFTGQYTPVGSPGSITFVG